jgi:hypothetical protein
MPPTCRSIEKRVRYEASSGQSLKSGTVTVVTLVVVGAQCRTHVALIHRE